VRVSPTAVVMPGSEAVVDYVAHNPLAIGYVSMGHLSERVKPLRIEGWKPTPLTVERGRYPLTRTLFFVIPRRARKEIYGLVDFALGPAGQRVLAERYGRRP